VRRFSPRTVVFQFWSTVPLSAVALTLALAVGFPAEGKAGVPFADRGVAGKTALVLGSLCCSAVYTPVKTAYAAGGTVAGGLAFLMSAGQSATAAGRIIDRSTGGDWFVEPDHLTGNQRLRFRGATTGPFEKEW